MKPNIELQIDELVLHGFAPSDRYRIGAAVERELGLLFVERGVPPPLAAGGQANRLGGGSFAVDPHPEVTAARIARAMYEQLGSFTGEVR